MENERKYAEEIRKQYQPNSETESKLEKLHKLDGAVRRPAEIFAYTFGVLGALILGVGMCLAMEVIGSMMPLGIVIGIVGIAMVAANYFIYRAILNSRKKKYADRVITLSDELLHSEQA